MGKPVRILVLADTHYIHPDPKKGMEPIDDVKWFLQILKSATDKTKLVWGQSQAVERWRKHWHEVNSTYIDTVIAQIAAEGRPDRVMLLGDQVNGYKNHGMITPLNRWENQQLLQKVTNAFGQLPIIVVGGHDAGYKLASGDALHDGGISPESIQACLEDYGSMYGSEWIMPGLNWIWLSSEPFMVRPELEHHFQPYQLVWLKEQRKIELTFLQETLANTKGKFVLAIHDNSALLCDELQRILDQYLNRLLVTTCGHFHARWLANLYYHFVNRPIREVSRHYLVQIVPSVWGVIFPTTRGFIHLGAAWAEILFYPESNLALMQINYLSRRKPLTIKLGNI
jgi:hypothetical protein